MSVVALGESLGLLVASRIGRLELVPTMDLGFGGAESNVAIGLARLGAPATWMGRLGADALGRLIERQLRAEGVTVASTHDPEAPTALMLKERPSAGASAVTYYRAGSAGSRLAPEHLDLISIHINTQPSPPRSAPVSSPPDTTESSPSHQTTPPRH